MLLGFALAAVHLGAEALAAQKADGDGDLAVQLQDAAGEEPVWLQWQRSSDDWLQVSRCGRTSDLQPAATSAECARCPLLYGHLMRSAAGE